MPKKYNYVYLTTNLINEKQYVGDHSTSKLDDGYLGSGDIILNSIKKNGKENFKNEILEFFDTKEEAFKAQEKYILLFKTHVSENGYNISWTGGISGFGGGHSDRTKKKMSLNNKGMKGKKHSKKTKDKMSNSQKKLNKKLTEETKGKIRDKIAGKNHPGYGKQLSAETKEKIKRSNIERYKDEELKKEISKKISKKMKGFIPWNKGIKLGPRINKDLN